MTTTTPPKGTYSFFDLDGAKFRRFNNGVTESVDDVLEDGTWVPYRGSDPLKPAMFGDQIRDPLASKKD